MYKKLSIFLLTSLLLFWLPFDVSSQEGSSIKLGTFTPTPKTPTPTKASEQIPPYSPPSTSPPDIDCVDLYQPHGRGNNLHSRSQVYGMLLKRHSGALDQRFAKADQDIIRLAQMNYHLFGRLPTTDDPAAIADMLGQQQASQLNYFYMKGFIRLLGIFGATFDELEQSLLGMSCELRIQTVKDKSSSPLRVFVEEETEFSLQIANQIFHDTPQAQQQKWEFKAKPTGKLFTDEGEFEEIRFDYKPLTSYLPSEGVVVSAKDLEEGIDWLTDNLNLYLLRSDISSFILKRVPKAPYYFLSIFPKDQADKALVWSIDPQPDREYKYIFYLKPLLYPIKMESIPQRVFSELRFDLKGSTVLDYNVLIDY